MFLFGPKPAEYINRFPRVSGDVPIIAGKVAGATLFSPRERGCSPAAVD